MTDKPIPRSGGGPGTPGALESATRILAGTASALVIDWPSRDVPESLVRARTRRAAASG